MEATEEKNLPGQNQEEQNNNQEEQNNKKQMLAIFQKVDRIGFFVLQAFILAMFALGTVNVFGEAFNLFRPISSLMDLTEYSSAMAYELIIGFELSLLYVAILIYMIYIFVQSLKRVRSKTYYATDDAMSVFFANLIFMAVACVFTEVGLTAAGILIFVLMPVCLIAHKLFLYFTDTNKEDILLIIFECVRFAVIFVLLGFLVAIFNGHPVVEKLVSGWNVMTRGFAPNEFTDIMYLFFNNFAEPVLFTALLIIVYKTFSCFLFSSKSVYTLKSQIKRRIIYVAVILVLHFIIDGLFAAGFDEISADSVGLWWASVKSTYFPVELLLICWLAALTFAGEKK